MRMSIAALSAMAVVLCTPALGQEEEHVFTVGPLTIEHPWARAAGQGDDTIAFMEIINEGPEDLVVSMTTDIAASVMLVGLVNMNGVIEMVPVGDFAVPTGTFEFDAGGLGLALTGLTEPLVQGEEFELTIIFENAGAVTFHVLIEAANPMAHGHNH